MKTKRDGNFLDEYGACKVCDGEIPYGHTDNCDIWKLEKELKDLNHAYKLLVQEREDFIKFTNSLDCPCPKELLVGPIQVAKHVINHLIRSRDLAVEDMKAAMERSEQKSRAIQFLQDKLDKYDN